MELTPTEQRNWNKHQLHANHRGRVRNRLSADKEADILSEYSNCSTIAHVCRTVHVSPQIARRVLKRHGRILA